MAVNFMHYCQVTDVSVWNRLQRPSSEQYFETGDSTQTYRDAEAGDSFRDLHATE